jgi:maltose alpha-D-glucosyltransferase/alpha-amylase
MLRSLSYAAHVGLVNYTNRRADEPQKLLGFSRLWERETSSRFLKAYSEAMLEARLMPEGNDLAALLEMFMLERTVHELEYEIRNRPDWAYIPMRGLLNLVEHQSV